MKCGTCGEEFPDIPAIKVHKPTCPGLKTGADDTKIAGEAVVNGQQETTTATGMAQYDPVEKGTSIGVTSAQYLRLKERYGDDVLSILHQRFDALLEEMLTGKKEAILDVSHLPKDTLAGLHRGAELKFEVIGWLEKDKDVLHVTNLQYPRRGR